MRIKNSDTWFSLVKGWQGSDLSQKAFCDQQGIAYSSFCYWCKKYRSQPVQPAGEPIPGFIPITINAAQPEAGRAPGSAIAELILPDGRRMNFYSGIDAMFLRTLLS